MKEVSCRVFDVFLLRLKQRNLPAELLVEGTSISLATLRNKNERIDWADLVAIMRNTRKVFSDEEYVDIGRQFLRSPMTRFISMIGGLLFSARDFYRWLNKAKDGAGNQMFSCITPAHREISASEIEVELNLRAGYDMCWDFFIVSKGMFMEVPRFVGLPNASVELTRTATGGRYRILVPKGDPVITRVRRTLLWPFTARAAARALKEAHEALELRFEELELARGKVDRQARQLRTAYVVSQLIHNDLDLDKTLEAVTRALVDEAGFVFAEVELATEVDGVTIQRSARHGPDVEHRVSRTLVVGGERRIGMVRVGTPAVSDEERERLLDFIVPTLSMAIDNAISYQVLADYRRGLETRVRERTLELSQARDTLAETVTRLEEAKKIRDQIFANVNHEIRTPLSAILLVVEQSRTNAVTSADDRAQRLRTIESSARKLLRLVDEMLLLAQGRERELELQVVVCDLRDALARIAEPWMLAAQAGGFELVVAVEPELFVAVDVSALERIVSNLLANAMKYTPGGGRIELRAERDGDRARVVVSDDGVGIDDELRGRLFGRFERGRNAVADGVAGSGLGLSLVKQLVEAQGGTIAIESAPNAGTKVLLEWPAVKGARADAVTTKLSPTDFGVATAQPDTREVFESRAVAKATILLAEDDPVLRTAIAELLAEDYRVVVATDGANALRLAEMYRPDLLVTDVAMPGMDGIELTRRFLAQSGMRVAPVLVVTAFGEIRDRLAGFEAGAVDYIIKPFEPAELRARIRSQLAIRALALKLLETERLAALGRLSAGLAHEMRNPANGIVNAIEPLRESLPEGALAEGSAAAELLDVVDRCGHQIATLSRHLLGFRSGAELERRPVPLDVLLARVRATARGTLDGIEVREQLDYVGPIACAEPLLQQALANLLDNAAYAAGRGGWVEVRTSKEEARVVVEFRDSGKGIAPELRDRIFEPFFTTKPPGTGTGLGLATAREIVVRHGGTLALHQASGGAVFRIEMPLEAG